MSGRSYYPSLLQAGIRVFEYQPEVHHAKAWILDRDRAAVGSTNLDNRSFRLNFECTCFLRHSGVNDLLASLFLQDLRESTEVTAGGLGSEGYGQRLMEAAANLLSPLM